MTLGQVFIKSISLRSQAAIVSENSTFLTFSYRIANRTKGLGSIRAIFGLIFKMTHFVSVYSIELVIGKNDDFLFILWSVTMATRTLSRIPFLTENTLI